MEPDPASPRFTVLIADDQAANRELIRTVLESEVEVVEVSDGAAALERVEAGDIDLLLLDVMMPGLTGYEVTRRLRASRSNEFLPILLVTSLTETRERVAGFEAGADDFITKPINTHELRLRVRAFLRTRRLHLERQAMLAQLQHLHDLKDDLATLLVHDLRNPLTGLMANLDLLESEPLTAGARESVTGAHHATRLLKEMVDDLLQVRLLEDGAQTIDVRRHDCGELVREAIATMAAAAEARGLHIRPVTPSALSVDCDATLVRRALENLLANAIRHSLRESEVVVRAETDQQMIRLGVEDAGPGIPREQRSLLFAKYGSTELRRGGRRSGHGLGLYLVSLVMQAHRGGVSVDDSFMAGTRVVMTLPRSAPRVAST
jgi:two-component system sensor histidine kinase/response regulator